MLLKVVQLKHFRWRAVEREEEETERKKRGTAMETPLCCEVSQAAERDKELTQRSRTVIHRRQRSEAAEE